MAFEYVMANHGLNSQSEYPYTAKDGYCCKTSARHGGVLSYKRVERSSGCLEAEVSKGPVAVAVDAFNWSNYKSGIFANCERNINHAVTVVGYTYSSWIIRNSWGAGWGDKGFIHLNRGNTCGVLDLSLIHI